MRVHDGFRCALPILRIRRVHERKSAAQGARRVDLDVGWVERRETHRFFAAIGMVTHRRAFIESIPRTGLAIERNWMECPASGLDAGP